MTDEVITKRDHAIALDMLIKVKYQFSLCVSENVTAICELQIICAMCRRCCLSVCYVNHIQQQQSVQLVLC